MTREDGIFTRLAAVVGRVFNTAPSELSRETSAADIDGWDSVSHAMVVLELEDEFGLRFDFEETVAAENLGVLATYIHDRVEEEDAIKSRASKRVGKPVLIFFGNCQAEVMAGHLKAFYPPLSDAYEIVYVPSYSKPGVTDNTLPSPEELASCAFLIEQRTPHVRFPEYARISNARIVTFPSLDLNVLWPLHAPEPRNAPRPSLPHGPNPYGDRIINKIVKEGLSGEKGWAAYVSQSEAAISNVSRLLEIERQRWELMERDLSVTMSDVIFGTFTERRIYSTYNHPSIGIISELATRILVRAGLVDGASEDEIRSRMNALFVAPFGEELQAPVHPKVARELGLSWWTQDLIYNWHGKRLKYETFIRRQIDWF